MKIKALQWSEVEQARSDEDPNTEVIGWEASALFGGGYMIDIDVAGYCLTTPDFVDSRHETERAARAAAQAHYDAAIGSAIEPITVDQLAAGIRDITEWHSLGAGALAEALLPFLNGEK